MRLVLEGYRCLYSPRIREGFFSETVLPTNDVLGNSAHKKSRGYDAPASENINRFTLVLVL